MKKKRNDKHGSVVTLIWATRNPFLATEAHKSNFHKRKPSFLQQELLNDFFSVFYVCSDD